MIRAAIWTVLYMALAPGANAQDLDDLRVGDMRGLVFHSAPRPVSDTPFVDMDDVEQRLSDLQGRYILLNFWATWCAPCRHEMPYLNTLQQELGGENFQVVTLATGRNPLPALRRFFEEEGIDALPLYRDPGQEIAREMGVFGLPVTVILNPGGQEIARLQGDADWADEAAFALLRALISGAN
ncbi:TlpA family protein disulfide reductase [Rhodophyticola sp. CCM32]|uniref:TlpA family protein disulfide reductase n=1 Tax=Rhodophyticola sp. CCM32 TaxID=2916397 RepID=UPI001EE4F308|nr:TlpA disulfide reductase family protein [Rhodophyticola sp. CCM32]